MKAIHQANEELLHLLFDWKIREGHMIRFSIEQQDGRWVLSFFSVDHNESSPHVLASFKGKNHDELKKWALDCLVTYQMNELIEC